MTAVRCQIKWHPSQRTHVETVYTLIQNVALWYCYWLIILNDEHNFYLSFSLKCTCWLTRTALTFTVVVQLGSQTGDVKNNWCHLVKNMFGWSVVVSCVCESILLPVFLCSTLLELCTDLTIGDQWNEKDAVVAAGVPCRTGETKGMWPYPHHQGQSCSHQVKTVHNIKYKYCVRILNGLKLGCAKP